MTLGAALVATVSVDAAAAGVAATVRADETRAMVGDVITVEFEVTRSGRGSVPAPELPPSLSEAFKVGQCASGSSRSSSFFGGGGSSTVARTVTCPLEAKTAGKHNIAFTTRDGGKTIASNTLTIEVSEAAELEALDDPTADKPTEALGDVFVWVSTDKKQAFVGEQVTFRLDVYEGRRFLDASMRTPPTFEGFFAEELPLPDVYNVRVEETAYRVRPGLRRALFPQRTGTLTIGAGELIVGRRARRRSAPIDIEVLPLPAEGRPAQFSSNNVGRYQITGSVDRDEVQPGEPFTLTYEIAGEGNIDVLDPGSWAEVPGVRRYDPKVTTERSGGSTVGGRRSYAFLMIPERPGKIEIPAHTLAFFDPEAEAYQTVASPVVEVVVGGDPTAIVASSDEAPEPAVGLEEPLAPVFSVETVPRRLPRERWLTNERWLYGMLGVPMLALLGLAAGMAWRRFGPDEAAVARARARDRRRARIEEAEAAVESGAGFHTALANLLQEVALDRAGPAGVGLPRPELIRMLDAHGVSGDERRRLESLLDRCDAARFGAQSGSASDRHALLDEALDAVRGLAKGAA